MKFYFWNYWNNEQMNLNVNLVLFGIDWRHKAFSIILFNFEFEVEWE